jgi:uncharacterized protein YdaU (DUF1376 family)
MATKARLPYVPWYHGDFLRSTAGWSLNERAIYWMLLCAQWESGRLPDDETRLAAIAGVDVSTMKTAWNAVIAMRYTKTRSGYINKRMVDHRNKYANYKKSLSDGGKKGMASRYGGGKVLRFPKGRERAHD